MILKVGKNEKQGHFWFLSGHLKYNAENRIQI